MRIISISVKAKNAVSVHRFLVSIPMDIQRHIFWQILGDAYSQSEFLPDEEALEQLVRALSAHYYEYKWPVSELCDNLFAAETKELAAILQAGNLDQLSSAWIVDLSLPSMKALFKEFRFFFIQDSLEGYTEGAVNNLESMIVEMLSQANNIDTKPKLNAFEKIGYLTLMANIFSKRDRIDFELFISMFYRWYCEGQILDVIFDTIYNSKNTSIKRILWNCLVDGCLQDHVLCIIVNERWKEFVRLNTLVPQDESYRFKTKEEYKKEEFVEPLGILDNGEQIDYRALYFYLMNDRKELKEDECSLEDFKKIFSKSQKKVKRITFHCKNEKTMGCYCSILHETFKEYVDKSCSIEDFMEKRFSKSLKFMKKNREEETESLYNSRNAQADVTYCKTYKELKKKFKNCGFKFKRN